MSEQQCKDISVYNHIKWRKTGFSVDWLFNKTFAHSEIEVIFIINCPLLGKCFQPRSTVKYNTWDWVMSLFPIFDTLLCWTLTQRRQTVLVSIPMFHVRWPWGNPPLWPVWLCAADCPRYGWNVKESEECWERFRYINIGPFPTD